MTTPTVLLIGGPETGKSNFLFRVWNHIFSRTGLLEMNGLPADLDYLKEGAACQLRGEYAGHTTSQIGEAISNIPICRKGDVQSTALLVVPDVDGEQINKVYRDRRWSPEWDKLITKESAFLVFVRVNSELTVPSLDWVACHEIYGFAPPRNPSEEAKGGAESGLVEAVSSQNVLTSAAAAQKMPPPTQVVLVDWLQFILATINAKYERPGRPRVGIVVTGWDCVPKDFEGGPADWIRENLPLLSQFCENNRESLEVAYFGSSIFSGDPEGDPAYEKSMGKLDPRTLGYVRCPGSDVESQDFTLPIAWALGWESIT